MKEHSTHFSYFYVTATKGTGSSTVSVKHRTSIFKPEITVCYPLLLLIQAIFCDISKQLLSLKQFTGPICTIWSKKTRPEARTKSCSVSRSSTTGKRPSCFIVPNLILPASVQAPLSYKGRILISSTGLVNVCLWPSLGHYAERCPSWDSSSEPTATWTNYS